MFIPPICSEREPDGSWEDCSWATGVMIGNVYVGEARFPSTRYEYESLREAGTGSREVDGDGSNYRELETGLRIRYGIPAVRRGDGWSAALDQAPVGSTLALQGLYAKLPARLRITGFLGGHSLVWCRDQPDSGLLLDPLALNGAAPRRATNGEMKGFYDGLPGGEWIAVHEREGYDAPMFTFNVERWKVPAGLPIYDQPNGVQVTKFSTATEVTTLGTPNGHTADGIIHGGWRAVLVKTAALDNVLRLKVCYAKFGTATAIATDPAWDATVLRALADPAFRGTDVVHAEAAEIAAATEAGRQSGLNDADAAIETLKGA